jgi:hypothetical protein
MWSEQPATAVANHVPLFARQIMEATRAVFGDAPLTVAVEETCRQYGRDVQNIQAGRGIDALLLAIVGAKGQGKTWAAKQFLRQSRIADQMHSGDLREDATTKLVWIGPVPPEGLDSSSEIYLSCPEEHMARIGVRYVLLDTPGLTDADHRAARLAQQALPLAPIKLLVIARDQLRSSANMTIARQIDGAICIPVISSVEPESMPGGAEAVTLESDLRSLRRQLEALAPRSQILPELLVPDFEISGDEAAAASVFLAGVLDRINDLGITDVQLGNTRELRIKAANERLQAEVARLIDDSLPRLAAAVNQLHRETKLLPQRVLDSLLGSESLLMTGVRMRLRARLINDTPLIWFPYRTLMSTLNLTQGAWDRVLLAMAGSVPSLFGALSAWNRNSRQNREIASELRDGIRLRTQQQVEEQLQPLCDRFHRELVKLHPRHQRMLDDPDAPSVRLSGMEEMQSRSQRIFDSFIDEHATPSWLVHALAMLGTLLFWSFMAGPIVLIYREYLRGSYSVFSGQAEFHFEDFPHPSPSLILTSLVLSLLPLLIYCMFVLTFALSRKKVGRVAQQIMAGHEQAMNELQEQQVIRLEFQDPLLKQAEILLQVGRA